MSDLAPFIGNGTKVKIPSEIKPPLGIFWQQGGKQELFTGFANSLMTPMHHIQSHSKRSSHTYPFANKDTYLHAEKILCNVLQRASRLGIRVGAILGF